jgi:hypothetical protein
MEEDALLTDLEASLPDCITRRVLCPVAQIHMISWDF